MFKNKTLSVLAAGFIGGALMSGCVVDDGDYDAVASTQAPLSSRSPATESPTPTQTGVGTGVRKAASARSGVKTT